MIKTELERRLATLATGGPAAASGFARAFGAGAFLVPVVAPPKDGAFTPVVEGDAVAAYETADILADRIAGPVEHVALSGRALAEMLSGAELAMALNGGALVPVDVLAAVASGPRDAEAAEAPGALRPPTGLTAEILETIGQRFTQLSEVIAEMWITDIALEAGAETLFLLRLSVEADENFRTRIAEAFLSMDAGERLLNIAFVGAEDPRLARARRIGFGLSAEAPEPAPRPPTPPRLV